ncbi:MAG TPA: CHAD domain-containing protein [Opitutaceae bacterium]
MAYRFKQKEPVSKAIRRLGAERLAHACECLRDSDHAAAVHCARKDIKKIRAVARLVRRQLGRKEFRWLTRRLREAATALAAPRDAYIKASALRTLMAHFKRQLAPGALRGIRARLRTESSAELTRFAESGSAKAVKKTLGRVGKRWSRLKVRSTEWKAVRSGVKAAYRQGQRAHQAVLEDPSSENFHEWRKRAKDLWYHVRLLQPIWPEQMEAMACELETLTEYLGNDHDLVVLRDDAEAHRWGNTRELATLNGLIDARQRALRADALAVGARFYAEAAPTFCDRLAGYWRTWRRERAPREASPKSRYTAAFRPPSKRGVAP